MPLTIRARQVKASFMETGKAMANTVQTPSSRTLRHSWVAPAETIAALAMFAAPARLIQAAKDRERAVLSRNEVMQEALGGRTWLGALSNTTGRAFSDLAAHIRFHDREGRPVGSPLSARASRLGPGDVLHLQARLPAEATGLRIHAMRWTRNHRKVEFGPGAPLGFGLEPDRTVAPGGLLPRRRNG